MVNIIIKQLNYGNIIKDLGGVEFMGTVKKEQEIDGHIKNKEENVCNVTKNQLLLQTNVNTLVGL